MEDEKEKRGQRKAMCMHLECKNQEKEMSLFSSSFHFEITQKKYERISYLFFKNRLLVQKKHWLQYIGGHVDKGCR